VKWVSSLLQAAGATAIVVGCWLFSVELGILVLGVALITAGLVVEDGG
jgi:hypothetical protein